MKNFIFASSLLILTAGTACADVIPSFTAATGANEFVKRYDLTGFNIASDSLRLRGIGEVVEGSVEINEGANQLRLTLNRAMNCPVSMMCPAVMPTPTIITLPIRHIESNVCGGITILAERNLQLVDGGLTRIEVQDLRGSRCGGESLLAVVKKVKVIVTEQGLRDRNEVVSVLSGIAAR